MTRIGAVLQIVLSNNETKYSPFEDFCTEGPLPLELDYYKQKIVLQSLRQSEYYFYLFLNLFANKKSLFLI
eukprot:snap_masked-scaffold_16-processed-gene-0.29-mRNA-1 protein AED:1.00 eAED:1.00 QI:0/0/0/0/1/1/4/0/70